MQRVSNFYLFLLSCLIALVILLIGLKIYFSHDYIESNFSYIVAAEDFQAERGEISIDKHTGALRVNAVVNTPSTITVQNINVGVDWYDRLEINFLEKTDLQSLLIAVKSQAHAGDRLLETKQEPILYTDKLTSRFGMNKLAENDSTITEIQLTTLRLIEPYQLKSIRLIPKKFNTIELIGVFIHDIFSSNSSKQQSQSFLISGKLLLVLYFSIAFVVFASILLWNKRPISSAWWWILIVLWLLLDVRYFNEKIKGIVAFSETLPVVTTPLTLPNQCCEDNFHIVLITKHRQQEV